ncbi:MAG: amino acid adenylation domain-containing protein, partial [Ginsengibacter sp.]
FPAERISFMLEDTNAKIIVSSTESSEKLGETDIEVITIDDIFSPVNTQPKTNPETTPLPENLAYVIYTSGSTGNPKGVMVEHRNLIDYVFGLKDATQIDQCKSFALVSTIATDLGNTVLFSSLLFGGALHVFTKEAVSNIYGLHEYFEEHAIECLKIVPSHWKALSKEEELLLPSKLLVFGGESLHSEIVLQIEITATNCRIVNHYGPTETTIGKLLNVVQKGKPYGKTIPIGKPFSNTNVYVLDKEMTLCPAGVPGQLYIAGDGLARGYLNNEALTKSKFIKDPFEDKSVMYSTGDLVKYLPDGNIEFIGRVDNQVKIRGYRIELGEIENVLQECELVSQGVVLAKEDKQGNKRLLAYIVPQDEFDREGIYNYLKEKLPEYMLPAVMIEIAELPLTANGKVDRKALPDPEAGEVQSGVYIAPTNDVEQKLAEIWQEVLEVDQVGVHDDFFELGGHSLLAIRLISMIRKELGFEVKIGDVFDYPTIALLSKRIEGQEDRTLLPTIEIKERPAKIPLSFSQERLWFIDQLEGSTQYHLPTILRLKGNLNVEALNYSLQQIVHRHQVLRTVYKEEGGIPFQHIKEDEKNAVQEIDGSQFKDKSEELFSFIKQLVKTPFDLSKDNMLKVYLIEVAPEDHVLVAVMHHISSDAWSTSIMVKEVVELYNSFIEQRSPQLPAMDLQYADYSIWQRNNLKGEIFENKVAYWKEQLKGVVALELPTDYMRPPVISTKGSFVNFSIAKELSDEIKKLSQKESTTLFIVLQTIYKAMLYRYSGQQDISVGTSIARREQQQLETLIGFFVNTLALRDEVDGESTFMELLHQVRATTMQAYEHQEVPFEKVVEAVLKERDKSRSPLFQVMLVFINTPEVGELRLGDIELSAEGYEQTTVKFEVTFFIRETANGFEGTVQYNTDLYKEETIKRMILHFNELLKSVIKDPNEKIDLLQMLTEEEEQQLLMEFN